MTMKYPRMILETKHCEEVLNQEMLIGSDSDGKKRFTFHVFDNEYRVWHNEECIDAGQALDELLVVYNSI